MDLVYDAADIPGVDPVYDDADIPGVDVAAIPRVDTVKLPGVDGDEEHAPDSVEIEDLDTTTDPPIVEAETVEQEAAPVEPAPVAQPAEPQGAHRSTQVRTQTRA